MKLKYQKIAIDFDGTIATIKPHPQIGELIPHADRVIRKLKNYGAEIIIWTCRSGSDEIKVKNFLMEHNIPYDKFNENLQSSIEEFKDNSRKVHADIYIDDKSLHCKGIDWLEIEKLLFEEE